MKRLNFQNKCGVLLIHFTILWYKAMNYREPKKKKLINRKELKLIQITDKD